MAKKVGSLLVDVAMNIAKIDRDVQQVNRKFDKMGRDTAKSLAPISKAFTNIQSNMLKLGTLYAAGRVFKSMITDAVTYEKNLKDVESLLDKNLRPAMKGFERDILKMSRTYGEGTASLTKGLYDIISASVSADKAMAFLGVSVKAAKAGLTDTKVAAAALTTVMNSYSLSADEAQNISDSLFTTIKYGSTTFEKLAPQLGRVTSLAASAGVSFEEVGAALSTLTRAGLPMEAAVTGLRSLIQAYIKSEGTLDANVLKTKGLIGALGSLRGASAEVIAGTFTSVEAMTAATVITSNYDAAMRDLAAQQNNTGAASDAFVTNTDSAAFALDKFSASMDAFSTQAGTMFLPALTAAANGMTSFLEEVEEGFKYVWEQMEELDKQRGLILRDNPTYGPRGVDAPKPGPRGAGARSRRGEGEFIRTVPAGEFPGAGATGTSKFSAFGAGVLGTEEAVKAWEDATKKYAELWKEANDDVIESTLGSFELRKQKEQEWLELCVETAEAAGRPAQIFYDAYSAKMGELAQEQLAAMEEIETASELALRDLQTFAQDASGTISNSFANFASSAMLDFENMGEAFGQMVSGMLSDIARLATQQLVTGLIASILPTPVKKAGGGIVPGYSSGGGVDDIPAMLQAGEFVVQRDAVKQMPMQFWDGLNRMHEGGAVLGFADGGTVPNAGAYRLPGLVDNPFRKQIDARTKIALGMQKKALGGNKPPPAPPPPPDDPGGGPDPTWTWKEWIAWWLENFGTKPDPGDLPPPDDWPTDPDGPPVIPEEFVPWGDTDFRKVIPDYALEFFDRYDYEPWADTLVRPKTPKALNKWTMPRLPKSVEMLLGQFGYDTRKDMSYDPKMYQEFGAWTDPLIAMSLMTGIKPEQLADLVPIAKMMQEGFEVSPDMKMASGINDMLTKGSGGAGVSGVNMMAEIMEAMYFHLGTSGNMNAVRPDIAYSLDEIVGPLSSTGAQHEKIDYEMARRNGEDLSRFRDLESIWYAYASNKMHGDQAGGTGEGTSENEILTGYLQQMYTRAYYDYMTKAGFDYLSPEGMGMLGKRPGWVDTGHPDESIGYPGNWLPSDIMQYTGNFTPTDSDYWDSWGDTSKIPGFEDFSVPGMARGGAIGIGLKPNEVPAILTRGEMVLNPAQYHDGGIVGYAGGGPVGSGGFGGHKTTINIINKTPVQIEAVEEFSMENFRETIKSITIRAVQTDPSYRALMQGG